MSSEQKFWAWVMVGAATLTLLLSFGASADRRATQAAVERLIAAGLDPIGARCAITRMAGDQICAIRAAHRSY
jgi:hypothetical protein